MRTILIIVRTNNASKIQLLDGRVALQSDSHGSNWHFIVGKLLVTHLSRVESSAVQSQVEAQSSTQLELASQQTNKQKVCRARSKPCR